MGCAIRDSRSSHQRLFFSWSCGVDFLHQFFSFFWEKQTYTRDGKRDSNTKAQYFLFELDLHYRLLYIFLERCFTNRAHK